MPWEGIFQIKFPKLEGQCVIKSTCSKMDSVFNLPMAQIIVSHVLLPIRRMGQMRREWVSHTERMQTEAKWTSAVGVLGIGSLGISKVPFHSDSMIPLPDSQVFPPATYFALCQGLCSCLTGFSRVMVSLWFSTPSFSSMYISRYCSSQIIIKPL